MALENHTTKTSLHSFGKHAVKTYRTAETALEEPIIPAPELFDTSRGSRTVDPLRLPTVTECAIHLEFLETLYVLRQRILRSSELDRVFGIKEIHETKTGRRGDQKTLKDKTLWNRRQVKWPRFIEFAVVRFLAWRQKGCQTCDDGSLPPLDVLMVWHSFLLNPRLFRQCCGTEPLYKLRFPWERIHSAIDNRDWSFSLKGEQVAMFEQSTGLPVDLFESLVSWDTLQAKDTGVEEEDIPDDRTDRVAEMLSSLKLGEKSTLPQWILELHASHQIRNHLTTWMTTATLDDSKLAVLLRDAVVRQTSFVDKMNDRLWIRSPAAEGVVRRGIDRYSKFLQLMKVYPKTMLVPTLDIDLAWHTHQCMPVMYYKGTAEHAGRFVNHDDTIVKGKLDDSFGETIRLYRVHFGKEYRVCGCWNCEALLSALEDVVQTADGGLDMEKIAQGVQNNVTYFKAVEVARRNKRPLPILG